MNIAVVVTCNRLALLKECLEALRSQTLKPDRVVVVDNVSEDGTREFLETLDEWVMPVLSEANLGGAGGFKLGMQKAMAIGAEWIWLMDDDTIPDPECLAEMLGSPLLKDPEIAAEIGFLCSRVDWTDGERCLKNLPPPCPNWNRFHHIDHSAVVVSSTSFVSCLVPARVVRDVGLPVAEFFIWCDDREYTSRIRKKYTAVCISSSVAVHKTGDNEVVKFTDATEDTIWKFDYGFRNLVAVSLVHNGLVMTAFRFLKLTLEIWMGDLPISKKFELSSSGFRGFFFNYRKWIEFADETPTAPVAE